MTKHEQRVLGTIHYPPCLQEETMAPRQISPRVLLILLCVAVFLPSVTVLMLGPLLITLAHEFQTSVAMVGLPLIACLLEAGSWRLPFAVMGTASLGVWLLFWPWFPRQQQPSQSLAFFSHYREVGAHAMFWYVLIANAFQQMGAFGMFG